MLGEVLEGHRAVEGDRQLHRGQRRAAPLEEVVVPAYLVRRDAEHLGPRGREPPLGRRARRVGSPARRRRVRAASAVSVFLSILLLAVSGRLSRQWKADGTMYSGSDSASRSRSAPASSGRGPGVEGHQALALPGPPGDDHRAVADAGHPQQGVLDLADLDAEAADLDLGIPAAEELQLAVGLPAAVVAAQVEPLALAVRIGQVGKPVRSGSLTYPRPTQTPEKAITPGAPSGTGDRCSSTT